MDDEERDDIDRLTLGQFVVIMISVLVGICGMAGLVAWAVSR